MALNWGGGWNLLVVQSDQGRSNAIFPMSIKALAATYRAEVSEALADDQIAEIRAHLQQQNVLGTDRLRDWVT